MGTMMKTADARPGLRDVGLGRRAPNLRLGRTWLDLMMEWLERSRQRRHLSALDDHMLKDIGLTRADVDLECDKPFWQV